MSNKWLKNLKAGDEVAIVRTTRGDLVRIDSVWQCNSKEVYVDGSWYSRVSGASVLTDLYVIIEVTPEVRIAFAALIRYGHLRRKVETALVTGLSLDQLERIAAILDETKGDAE